MVRKLSLGSWRRWSKANRDGSLRENMAKADIKASPRGIAGSSDRGSGTSSQRARTRRKRASAERCLRAFLAERPMAGNSFCPKVKMGKPGKYFVSWLYERQGQNRQPVPKNSTGRELLFHSIPPWRLARNVFPRPPRQTIASAWQYSACCQTTRQAGTPECAARVERWNEYRRRRSSNAAHDPTPNP